jgi:uncharacterized protein YcaQ
MTLAVLRRYAVARSLFIPADLQTAIDRFGFIQADPIRAPARAQDLTLRHRVVGYRAGDLERRYRDLAVEEDVFINYGYVARRLRRLMHPRDAGGAAWTASRRRRAEAVVAFVRERGPVHPRDVDRHFAHGRVTNDWGGTSSATTRLLEQLHYRGVLRVAGRDGGVRLYAVADRQESDWNQAQADDRIDALVDVAVRLYAPMPARTLSYLIARLRYAAPQWHGGLRAARTRALQRLNRAAVDGTDWYWPEDEQADDRAWAIYEGVRLLAPFDPVVWDRDRFERFWGWAYRFEAYTPVARRKLGYYALPLLWRGQVIGWGNLSVKEGMLSADVGYVDGTAPRDRRFTRALEDEIERMRTFLG